ncbi:ABC transporter permease [Hyphomicrobium sp. LHD-15]|uniref:ABC transporter permease n=1 Tax=Hyphomicrobium sp. LHD-15 TaxID=3072142 RepID=UPI00280F28D2|nr:ABC transporter permease [Hyphomicrobium sp. LHD-15]MDQ8697360.1 ABC transporter permease [Hyphomicrobium sp. LHD-15]
MSVAASSPVRLGAVSVASAVGFLLLLEIVARFHLMPATLLPAPSSVALAFESEFQSGRWLANVLASLSHYAVGVAIGTLLGIGFGLATAQWPLFNALTEGIARLLRPISPIAWLPFAIIWFGIGEAAAAFIIATGVFWLNYIATQSAARAVDTDKIELAHAFGQGAFFTRIRKIVLPGAAPGILSGVRAGVSMGWIAVLAAEMLGVAGVGQRLLEASGVLATDLVVLYMATIAALYCVTDTALEWLTRRLLPWTH